MKDGNVCKSKSGGLISRDPAGNLKVHLCRCKRLFAVNATTNQLKISGLEIFELVLMFVLTYKVAHNTLLRRDLHNVFMEDNDDPNEGVDINKALDVCESFQ
jgi:hypothetical protein